VLESDLSKAVNRPLWTIGLIWGLSTYTGIFLQQGFLYLFAIWLPVLLFRCRFEISRPVLGMAIALLFAWWVFPLSNWLAFEWPARATVGDVDGPWTSGRGLFRSLMPASCGATGLMLLIYAGLQRWFGLAKDGRSPIDLIRGFWLGLLVAMVVFGVYFAGQHFWGWDFRGDSRYLGTRNLMGSRYRVPGFFGHPLTMATVSLAWCAFTGVVAASGRRIAYLPGTRTLWLMSALSFIFVAFSGGRAAIVVALVCVVGCVAWASLRQLRQLSGRRRFYLTLSSGISIAGIALVGYVQLSHRVVEVIGRVQSGGWESIERLTFWRVYAQMFRDSSWYGQGHAQLGLGLREAYYAAMGFGAFHEKYNAHNVYLELLGSAGLIGLVVVLSAIWVCVCQLRRQTGRIPHLRVLALAWTVAIGANAIHGLTQNTLFDASAFATYMSMLWFILWQVNAVEEPEAKSGLPQVS
jgi:hypothetical protein